MTKLMRSVRVGATLGYAAAGWTATASAAAGVVFCEKVAEVRSGEKQDDASDGPTMPAVSFVNGQLAESPDEIVVHFRQLPTTVGGGAAMMTR
mmetsp:Transcript_115834/g.225436  ORF Transcript_115834/g.225436 Transcript_115834/m.225436 type:complete len:93 (+) Transcript_115834:25-303(+)